MNSPPGESAPASPSSRSSSITDSSDGSLLPGDIEPMDLSDLALPYASKTLPFSYGTSDTCSGGRGRGRRRSSKTDRVRHGTIHSGHIPGSEFGPSTGTGIYTGTGIGIDGARSWTSASAATDADDARVRDKESRRLLDQTVSLDAALFNDDFDVTKTSGVLPHRYAFPPPPSSTPVTTNYNETDTNGDTNGGATIASGPGTGLVSGENRVESSLDVLQQRSAGNTSTSMDVRTGPGLPSPLGVSTRRYGPMSPATSPPSDTTTSVL